MYNFNSSSNRSFLDLLKIHSVLTKLIGINVVIWFLLNLVQLTGYLMHPADKLGDAIWLQKVLEFLAVPAFLVKLAENPWTLVTYMFVHEGFWHLIMNMFWLYWFGKIFLEFLNSRKLVIIYFLGGISGALAFILAYNFFPVFSNALESASTIGASASVLAITIATAVLVPDYSVNLLFIGNIKIKYIALFVVILDVLMIRSGNAGGHFAHLGGALSGMLYIFVTHNLSTKKKSSLWKNLGINSFFKKPKLKKVHVQNKPLTDEEYNEIRANKQKQIDEILDKISRSGYSSLSSAEKELLFKNSK